MRQDAIGDFESLFDIASRPRSTAPMWTPLFGVVAGLISEAGGILSHPAVVVREFGLPAVVGVRSATNLIKDGQMVTVSGSSGLITW